MGKHDYVVSVTATATTEGHVAAKSCACEFCGQSYVANKVVFGHAEYTTDGNSRIGLAQEYSEGEVLTARAELAAKKSLRDQVREFSADPEVGALCPTCGRLSSVFVKRRCPRGVRAALFQALPAPNCWVAGTVTFAVMAFIVLLLGVTTALTPLAWIPIVALLGLGGLAYATSSKRRVAMLRALAHPASRLSDTDLAPLLADEYRLSTLGGDEEAVEFLNPDWPLRHKARLQGAPGPRV